MRRRAPGRARPVLVWSSEAPGLPVDERRECAQAGRKGRGGQGGQGRADERQAELPLLLSSRRAHTHTHESVALCGQNPTSPKRKTRPNAAGVRDGDDQDSPLHSSHSQLLFEVLARDYCWVSEEWG